MLADNDSENTAPKGDRRKGERRKSQQAFDGPDRRKGGDRRSGTDRRETKRRSDDSPKPD